METIKEVREHAAVYGLNALTERQLRILLKLPIEKPFSQLIDEGNQTARAIMNIARRHIANENPKKLISSSKDLQEIMFPYYMEGQETEHFYVVFLNRANRVLGVHCHSQGGMTGTIVDIIVLMKKAVEMNATCIALSHNHPSGTPLPSHEDKTITRQIKEACMIMQITLIDHIILAGSKYYSFADEGQL